MSACDCTDCAERATDGPLTVESLIRRALVAEARLREAEAKLRTVAAVTAQLVERHAEVTACMPGAGESAAIPNVAGRYAAIAEALSGSVQRYAAALLEVAS